MTLTPQQVAELAFWRELVGLHGEYYVAFRASEYHDKTHRFPSFLAQEGIGIDIGCGCVSVFECSSKKLIEAIDPLAEQYVGLLGKHSLKVSMYGHDIESLQSNVFLDWAACLNMLDHTPNPALALANIRKLLKPNGRLYFEVHLDSVLSAPHYHLWKEQDVRQLFDAAGFEITWSMIQPVPEHGQERFWLEAVKRP